MYVTWGFLWGDWANTNSSSTAALIEESGEPVYVASIRGSDAFQAYLQNSLQEDVSKV